MSSRGLAAARLAALLREWDSGAKSVRRRILQDFIVQNEHKTAPQLDAEFADASSLFLSRLCAWLRLTYLIGTCLSELLEALQIFLTASGGHKFLTEFLEVGGVLTVVEILGVKQAKEADKAEALQLLICVAGAGRQYKELICESYGIRATAECLAKSRSELTQERARNLLQTLTEGNPKFQMQAYKGLIALLPCSSPKAQQMAAQTLRVVQPIIETAHPSIVEPTLNLLKTLHPEVQFEGIELLKQLVEYDVRGAILVGLVQLLRPSSEQLQMLLKSDLINESDVDKLNAPLPVFIQQAAAAKCIRILSSKSSSVSEEFTRLQVASNLMHAMGRTDYAESRRQASMTLEFFCRKYPIIDEQVRDAIGDNLYNLFMSDAEAFYSKMTTVHADILLSNKMQLAIENRSA